MRSWSREPQKTLPINQMLAAEWPFGGPKEWKGQKDSKLIGLVVHPFNKCVRCLLLLLFAKNRGRKDLSSLGASIIPRARHTLDRSWSREPQKPLPLNQMLAAEWPFGGPTEWKGQKDSKLIGLVGRPFNKCVGCLLLLLFAKNRGKGERCSQDIDQYVRAGPTCPLRN